MYFYIFTTPYHSDDDNRVATIHQRKEIFTAMVGLRASVRQYLTRHKTLANTSIEIIRMPRRSTRCDIAHAMTICAEFAYVSPTVPNNGMETSMEYIDCVTGHGPVSEFVTKPYREDCVR